MSGEATPAPIDIGAPLLTLDVVVTLADHVSFNVYLRDRPSVRRRRIVLMAAALVGGPLFGLAMGFAIGWATDPAAHPFWPAVAALGADDWRRGLGAAAAISGALATAALLLELARRPLLARRLRGHLAERIGIDPADPARRSRLRVTLAEAGFAVDGEGSHTVIAAASVRAVDEAGGAFMLMVGRMAGFVVPMRDLSAEQVAAFRRITAGWLAGRGRGGG